MSKKKKQPKQSSKKQVTTKQIPSFDGKISLVIPCYNESERVPLLVNALKQFDQKWKGEYETIIIDDGSSDDTVQKIQAAKLPYCQIISLEKNDGKGAALQRGVAAATGTHILTLDADMATSPLELANWLQQLPDKTFSDNDILIGSREHPDSTIKGEPTRRLMGIVFNFIIQLFTSLNLKDTQCGFKLYPAAIAKDIFQSLRVTGWAHDVELLYKANLQGTPIQQMPVTWEDVKGTKISPLRDSFRMLLQALFISLSVKWDWFIRKPLQRTPPPPKGEPPIFRLLFVVAAAFLFLLMPLVSSDYGMTGDEHTQRVYGDKLLKNSVTDGEDESYLKWKNLKYYGGLFDYATSRLNPPADPAAPYYKDKNGKEYPDLSLIHI